jgi:hypothetical protein
VSTEANPISFAFRILMTRNIYAARPASQGSGLKVLFASCAQSRKALTYGIRKQRLILV